MAGLRSAPGEPAYLRLSRRCSWALAHPSPTGGVAGAAVEFLGVFALTQIPLAVIEGLVTTAAVLALEQCAQPELRLLKSWNEGRAAQ